MMMEKNGSEDSKSEGDSKSRDQNPRYDVQTSATNVHKSPKKRRKVNHACVYCRRSHMTCDLERPCTRCIKRNIGHLCHDEPRDPDSKKPRSVQGTSLMDESETRSEVARSTVGSMDQHRVQPTRSAFGAALSQGNPLQLVQPTTGTGIQAGALNSNLSQFTSFNDAWLNNPFHDMHNYHPNYMIPEVSHEFNLLNDFLHSSLLDDGVLSPEDSNQILKTTANSNDMNSGGYLPASAGATSNSNNTMLPPSAIPSSLAPPRNAEQGVTIPRPASVVPIDKTKEYYMEAADPNSNEGPDDRMERVMRAKYEAGMLKPFNYTKGYSMLLTYLDGHIAAASKQKILRQLDRFRPKFREKVEKLTDMHLVMVEVWFEKTLMEYDRVFASMAVPACCWRRSGEIFRGNKEMAELINVPVDRLRDGKISLHEILTEESLVRYWEEFGTIAFDPDHESLLTASALKNPDEDKGKVINCCFSFMIRRDQYNLPSLIVGNFLPHDPE